MSQKPEKHWKKQGLSAVRDIELHMRTMGGNERSQTVYTNGQRKSKIAIDRIKGKIKPSDIEKVINDHKDGC